MAYAGFGEAVTVPQALGFAIGAVGVALVQCGASRRARHLYLCENSPTRFT